jgi:hypothetical protein
MFRCGDLCFLFSLHSFHPTSQNFHIYDNSDVENDWCCLCMLCRVQVEMASWDEINLVSYSDAGWIHTRHTYSFTLFYVLQYFCVFFSLFWIASQVWWWIFCLPDRLLLINRSNDVQYHHTLYWFAVQTGTEMW